MTRKPDAEPAPTRSASQALQGSPEDSGRWLVMEAHAEISRQKRTRDRAHPHESSGTRFRRPEPHRQMQLARPEGQTRESESLTTGAGRETTPNARQKKRGDPKVPPGWSDALSLRASWLRPAWRRQRERPEQRRQQASHQRAWHQQERRQEPGQERQQRAQPSSLRLSSRRKRKHQGPGTQRS